MIHHLIITMLVHHLGVSITVVRIDSLSVIFLLSHSINVNIKASA